MKTPFRAAIFALAAVFALVFSIGCKKPEKSAAENLSEADGIMAQMNSQGETDPALARQAEECYGRALKGDPKNPRAAYGRGMARARNNNFGAALEDFNQAVALDPKNPEAYYRRAMCRIANTPGNKAEALSDLKKTLELNPTHPGAARMIKLLSAS